MRSRIVHLDDEAEQALAYIIERAGLSRRADALKQGLVVLRQQMAHQEPHRPYDIYAALDLGPGGEAVAPSTETRRGVSEALRRKLRR